MRIAFLGPLVIDGGTGKLGPRDRVVLAALAVRPGETRTADGLADALWGDHPPASAKTVNWVTYSPDSKTLVSVGFDGQVSLSDPTDVLPFARVQPGQPNLRSSATYLDDGHTLVLAYGDGSVISLDTDPAAWQAHACAVAGRNLAGDEWTAAFPTGPIAKPAPRTDSNRRPLQVALPRP